MATPEKHGLAKQFTRLIVLSGLASFLLLGFLQVVLNKGPPPLFRPARGSAAGVPAAGR